MCWTTCSNVVLNHIYDFNSGCVFFKIQGTNSFEVENSYIWKNFDNSSCHGQMWLTQGTDSNVDFHDNIIRDITGTGVWVSVTGGQLTNWIVYNNVIWHTQGNGTFGLSNGIICAVNSGSQATNFQFIGNSIVNEVSGYTSGWNLSDTSGSSTITVKNNLWYGSDSVNSAGSVTVTASNNSVLNGSQGGWNSGTGAVNVSSGAPNPFTNWPSGVFTLASENSDWINGATLSSPYNVDAVGNVRPGTDGDWDRGVYEYASTQGPVPPTNLNAVVH